MLKVPDHLEKLLYLTTIQQCQQAKTYRTEAEIVADFFYAEHSIYYIYHLWYEFLCPYFFFLITDICQHLTTAAGAVASHSSKLANLKGKLPVLNLVLRVTNYNHNLLAESKSCFGPLATLETGFIKGAPALNHPKRQP